MIPLPPFSVKLDITDVAYVTYMVPAERLRPVVPKNIVLAMNGGKAFLSLVLFHNRKVRASFFPFIRFNYDQMNVRTYITDPLTGKTAVLFLHSGITSATMSFATKFLGIPWPEISLAINAAHNHDRVAYSAVGEWGGEVDIRLRESGGPEDYTPFQDMKEAVEFLVTPTAGVYAVPEGVIRFEVQHTFVVPSAGSPVSIHFPMLEKLGYLVNEEVRHPHNILITGHGFFRVLLPPKLIRL
jgi:hypothetical protein